MVQEAKAGKPMKGAGVATRKQQFPVLPECNSDCLRRSESGEVNGRKSESINRLPSKKGGREAPNPVLINDEMQLRASVMGSVCRWSQVEKQKASG